jgi:glutathione S-transferase
MRVLYELAGAEDRRFSPFCWRARMALAHKGLEAKFEPCGFGEIKAKVGFSGHDRVPVLQDGARAIPDSWAIARYLEDSYPDRPSLFGGTAGMGLARFVNDWTDRTVHPALARLVTPDVYDHVSPEDRDYFKKSRETRFAMSFEQMRSERPKHVPNWMTALAPLKATFEKQQFLTGEIAGYADYILFGAFQWARCTSPFQLLDPDDPIYAWRERMLNLFDGLARKADGYPV